MSQSSIKKNFAYKSILTISTYLISFITFPYVARVLGVEHIGLVNFVDNTVNYFYYSQRWELDYWVSAK